MAAPLEAVGTDLGAPSPGARGEAAGLGVMVGAGASPHTPPRPRPAPVSPVMPQECRTAAFAHRAVRG